MVVLGSVRHAQIAARNIRIGAEGRNCRLAAKADVWVGSDLAEGAATYVEEDRLQIALAVAIGLLLVAAMSAIRELRYRRRRGRWGLLQDRFHLAATDRGAVAGSPNPRLAAVWTDADDAATALLVAERLDRVAFDPTFADDGTVFMETRKLVGSLPRRPR